MKLIKTNRKGVWKELRRLKKLEQGKVQSKYEKPTFKSSIEKFIENQTASETKTTVDPICKIKNGRNSAKVFEHHMRHFHRKNAKTDSAEEKIESTVFTDKDFDKFEEEYDFFK